MTNNFFKELSSESVDALFTHQGLHIYFFKCAPNMIIFLLKISYLKWDRTLNATASV